MDKNRIEQLIEENRGLILNVIKKHYPSVYYTYDFEDYIQEGYIALYNAIKYFDESKGCQFSTLATRFIRNCLYTYSIKAENKMKQISSNIISTSKEIGPGITILDALRSKIDIENSYVESSERKEIISKLNKILPKKSKVAFQLMLQRKSRKEISEILGCTNQNIDSCIRIIKKHVEEIKREAA